jgi:hypothetical protein
MSTVTPTVEQVIGANVADLRASLGMGQADLGAAMVARGFDAWEHRQTVGAVERGVRALSWAEMLALAEVLGCRSPRVLMVVRDRVAVGGSTLSAEEWSERWGIAPEDRADLTYRVGFFGAERKARRREAVEALRQRERRLAERQPAGPTFLAEKRTWIGPIELRPGVPYVARDRLERAALVQAEQEGRVTRIDRHKAARLRAKGNR